MRGRHRLERLIQIDFLDLVSDIPSIEDMRDIRDFNDGELTFKLAKPRERKVLTGAADIAGLFQIRRIWQTNENGF